MTREKYLDLAKDSHLNWFFIIFFRSILITSMYVLWIFLLRMLQIFRIAGLVKSELGAIHLEMQSTSWYS